MPAASDTSFGRRVAGVGWFLMLAALTILGWQVFFWLAHGFWSPVSLRNAMAYVGINGPAFNSLNARQIWNTIAEGAFSFYLFMVGGLIALLGVRLAEKTRGKISEEKSKRRWGLR